MERLPHSSVSRANTAKMTIMPKAIYRFNVIPIEIPIQLFTDTGKIIFTFI